MSLSFIHHKPLSYSSCIVSLHHSTSHHLPTSKSFFLFLSKAPTSSLSLCASPSNTSHSSTTSVSFPYLHQQQEEEDGDEEDEEEEEDEDDIEAIEGEEGDDPDDPIYKSFKTGTWISSQDPQSAEKLHLFTEPDEEPEMGLELEGMPLFSEEEEEMGCCQKKELPEAKGILGEIVQLARNLPQNLTPEEAFAEYKGRVSEKDCWEVLEILGEDRLMMCCLCFFQWMRLEEPSLVTPRACVVLFPLLGKAGMGDKLMDLLTSLPSSKEFRDVHVYNVAISGLLSSGRYEDAWKVYESMETENVHPDHVTCSIMVTVMRELDHSAKDAWQFFEKMNRKGVRWSEEVLASLIKSFCVEGLMREALIIQSEMEKKGVSSNATVYNTLMDAFCKFNRVEEAEGLFVEMKAKGIMPTAATFNILMHAYSRRMQPKIVEKLLEEMQGVGLKPNSESYTALIYAYGKKKKMSDMAAEAFLKMKKFGIKPTLHSYTALIHAYSVSGLHEKACVAFENMLREGIKPSIETYTTLLDVLRRAGDTPTLMKIWKFMMIGKVEGTQTTFHILVHGFAKQGLYMEARDVISEYGKLGLHPTLMTYNMLLNAYARGGRLSKLPQLLKEMAALQLKPDSITYSTMIYAFVRVHDFKRAFYYHKQMIKGRQMMDDRSYQNLYAILDSKAATKNKDRNALLAVIKSKLGLKAKSKKDEFWKFRGRRVRKT